MRDFFVTHNNEYVDIDYLVKFWTEGNRIKAMDKNGRVYILDIIDDEWLNEWYDGNVPHTSDDLYAIVAEKELKRIMTSLLDFNII